jgi:DNA-binding MarR family transcriptional regulator
MRPFKFIRVDDLEPALIDVIMEVPDYDGISNRELATRLRWSEARTSRAVDELMAAGRVTKIRAGKCVAITIA